MADSKRLEALKGLVNILQDITTANGYRQDVAEVSRHYKDWEETQNFPRINVLANQEQITDRVHGRDNIVNLSEFSFRLEAFVKAEDDIEDRGVLSDKIEDLIADIKKAILGTPSLNTNFIYECNVDFVDSYFDWGNHTGIMVLEGHMAFKWEGTDP